VGGEPRRVATAKEQAVALDQGDAGCEGGQPIIESRGSNVHRLAAARLVAEEPADVGGAVEASPGIVRCGIGVNKAAAHIGVQRRAADAQAGGGGFGGEKAVLGHGLSVY